MLQGYNLIKPKVFYTSESSCKRAQNTRISFVILYIYSRLLLKHVWREYIAVNNILSPHILHNFKHCFLTKESEKLKYIIHCSCNGRSVELFRIYSEPGAREGTRQGLVGLCRIPPGSNFRAAKHPILYIFLFF